LHVCGLLDLLTIAAPAVSKLTMLNAGVAAEQSSG
jgi:hypothetical protein